MKTFESFNQNFAIYQDMDGCLTNFNKNFVNLPENVEGLTFEEYAHKHGRNSGWPMVEKAGLDWWANMEWLADGKKLWEFVNSYNATILSAPSRDTASVVGKMIWIKRELGINQSQPTTSPKKWDMESRVILNSEKFMFAKRHPNSILIDDTPTKIEKWIAAGGIGILHKNADKTISELTKIISNL